MFKRNMEIRKAKGDIPLWVIAEKLNVHENTLYNWMKKEMDEQRKAKVLNAIKEIKDGISKRNIDQ